MITNTVLGLVSTVLAFFLNLMPSFTLPSWLTSGLLVPSGAVTTLGEWGRSLNPFFPVDTILTVLGTVLDFWPALAGYLVFQWVWKHVPTIAGFGTGDG